MHLLERWLEAQCLRKLVYGNIRVAPGCMVSPGQTQVRLGQFFISMQCPLKTSRRLLRFSDRQISSSQSVIRIGPFRIERDRLLQEPAGLLRAFLATDQRSAPLTPHGTVGGARN